MSKCNDTCKYYKNCWSRGERLIEDGEECVLYEPDRPRGEWRDFSDMGFVECPFCEHATNCDDNIEELHYCFFCGAVMRKEGEKE